MKRYLLLATFGLTLLSRPAAQAQDLGGALDLGQLGRDLSMSAAIRADAQRRADEMGVKLDDAKTTKTAGSAASLRYTPTPALRQQTVDNLARRLQATSPAQAQAARSFAPGAPADYARLYSAGLKGSGFQDNDAASALASYLEVAYAVVNDVQDPKTITPGMDRGLRNQMAGLLSQSAAAKSPAQLAQLGEEMKLQTVVLMAGWQQSRQAGQGATFRSTLARNFSAQFGFDLAQVRLTERGFVPR